MIGVALYQRHFNEKRKFQAISSHKKDFKSHSKSWNGDWDHLSPSTDEKENGPKSKASRYIILVRHGHFVWKGNKDSENGLTKLGEEQADFLGMRLKGLEPTEKYTAIHRSTMRRTVETSNVISRYLPDVAVKADDLLREGTPSEPESFESGTHNVAKHVCFQDSVRIEAAFRKYFYRASPEQEKDSYEIIVGHANVIRYFVCRALQVPPEAWLRFSHGHCGVTRVDIRPNGRVVVKSFGDTGHLPPPMLTFS
jgi:serine/threonine-protein phosphatase PGAM5